MNAQVDQSFAHSPQRKFVPLNALASETDPAGKTDAVPQALIDSLELIEDTAFGIEHCGDGGRLIESVENRKASFEFVLIA